MISAQEKIKAFTLNEMLVVLLITAIVVGMAFSILNLVQRQMHGIEGNYERNTELNLLKQSLWIDFNQFDGIWYLEEKNELLFTNELKEIKYSIKEKMVIKELDTFHIQLTASDFYFKGDLQKKGEIDALNIQTAEKYGSQRVFVFKKNAAISYLNQ